MESFAARSQLRLIRQLLKARVGEVSTRGVQTMLAPGYLRPEKQCFLLQMMQKAGKLDDRKLYVAPFSSPSGPILIPSCASLGAECRALHLSSSPSEGVNQPPMSASKW